MKIVFDNSIHLGQFAIDNEQMRIFAKNSQIMISQETNTECIGVVSFNENTFSDDILWEIPQEVQAIFFKFMDVYHSVKNIDRVELNNEDAETSLKISRDLNIHISNALTCAIATRIKADQIHSCYSEFQKENVLTFLGSRGIVMNNLSLEGEHVFMEDGLEKYYQDALDTLRKAEIDLTKQFHI